MKIVWDEPKRLKNVEKHGLDFAELEFGFFADALIIGVRSGRLKAIGPVSDTMIAVIFVMLGAEGVSLISLRPASRQERRLYEQRQQRATSAD
jgi:uncharacterized DUF497 family protein